MDIAVLRVDFEALRKNSVWNALQKYMDDREKFFMGQLTSGKIGEPIVQGAMWQKMIEEIKKFKEYPDRVVNPTED